MYNRCIRCLGCDEVVEGLESPYSQSLREHEIEVWHVNCLDQFVTKQIADAIQFDQEVQAFHV